MISLPYFPKTFAAFSTESEFPPYPHHPSQPEKYSKCDARIKKTVTKQFHKTNCEIKECVKKMQITGVN